MNNQDKSGFVPGMIIGHRYELLRTLRAEAHGEVMLARDQVLDVDVGLKLLSNEDPDFDRLLDYYRREALWGLRLHHPQILGVQQLDETAEGVYLIQEPFAGNSLWELLGHSDALTINDSLYFIEVLAQGVAYGHKQGVIHQSFNPQQVLVSATEGIKIINFAFPAEPPEIHGFPEIQAYIAPEAWQGRHPSAVSNLFSLGVIGYRMLTGAVPFPLLSEGALPYQMSQEPAHLEKIPEALRPLFSRCLKAEPEKRFHTAADFLSRLAALRENLAPASIMKPKRLEEEFASPTDLSSEPASQPTIGSPEPEVEIDTSWQDSAPIYRRNFWDTSKSWISDQQQRAMEFLGPEPLRRNRNKQVTAAIGSGLAFLLLLFGLSSLFTPKPTLETVRKLEPVDVSPTTPVFQEPAATKPPLIAAAPVPHQGIGSEQTGTQAQPAQPKPAPPTPATPGTGAAASSPAKVKTPAAKPAPVAAAKPEKTASKPAATPSAEAKATKADSSPKLVQTFANETTARKHADSLTKQGQRAIVRKSTQGGKTVYQVWLTAAATPPAKPAATPPKPKTASKTDTAKPR